ncbi:beta-glucan synthesis-associated [Pluteus cervinus]|uniref:Beta-glucan synthesis-associated n=1 Tax=Pluteus cervinus TaxID=181527 RepID=A0ACD3BHV1_9AGAR|nr:beta-glucan synthesis-associated [Pluteus cervinus]
MSSYMPPRQRYYYHPDTSTTNLLAPGPPKSLSGGFFSAPFAQGPASLPSTSSNATSVHINTSYSLSPDPSVWGPNVFPNFIESDDDLHNPDPQRDRFWDDGRSVFTLRGLSNLGCLIVLGVGLVGLFAAYPIVSHFTSPPLGTVGGFNIGGINGSGQIPVLPGGRGLIDIETPQEAYKKASFHDGSQLQLVFSDEFNTNGRTFYPGDDPYWEAVDLHYWATNNLEWYDPAAITTQGGALEITFSQKQTHGLNYQGGLLSTWNKFCFTGGLIEASVSLPGISNVAGFWPAIWTLGNLGRAGYGASLEGTWPYTYDACDVGTAPNQTLNGGPAAALTGGDPTENGALSFLPGQRLSRCTCAGEPHPGPVHSDGSFVGRSAPEIDVLEAQVTGAPLTGQVSQSAQWAPFNAQYAWFNTTNNYAIADPSMTFLNPYRGGAFQQASSGVTKTNPSCYQLGTGCFSSYGFEYKPGFDGAYIHWLSQDTLSWTIHQAGIASDPQVQISDRPIPQEPMYIIMNLGMSENFGTIDYAHLTFPAVMRVDWIRVYQRQDSINVGCNPADFPTEAYINQYIEAYTNPNLTTWRGDYGQTFPKNKFLGQC